MVSAAAGVCGLAMGFCATVFRANVLGAIVAGLGAVVVLRYFAGTALRAFRVAGFEGFTVLARAAVPDLRTAF
jgi:hypothetical protein